VNGCRVKVGTITRSAQSHCFPTRVMALRVDLRWTCQANPGAAVEAFCLLIESRERRFEFDTRE
jgi:hypothetical protein